MEAMLWFVIGFADLVALIWAIGLAIVANRGEK
jgi:hypothetical protein